TSGLEQELTLESIGFERRRLDTFRQIAAAGEGFKERVEPRRLPARRRHESTVEEGAFAVAERHSVWPIDEASGGQQHGVTRGGVPLTCGRSAGIDVGPALRDDTKFERRTHRYVAAGADRCLEIIERRLIEVRLGCDGGDLGSARPRTNRLASDPFVEPGALAH